MPSTVHLLISGTVQNVFFRVETQKTAQSLGIHGWIKNLASGQVEAYATGERNQLEKFVKWCHEGPTKANVTDVNVEWDKDLGKMTSFEIRT
jgi:acylphosphatase